MEKIKVIYIITLLAILTSISLHHYLSQPEIEQTITLPTIVIEGVKHD